MAWAAQRSDGTVDSVGFDHAQAPTNSDLTVKDVPDNLVISVLEGTLNLQHLFTGPPASTASQPEYIGRKLGNSSYPTMMSQTDIDALSQLARSIPLDAIAVEIGSRLGGSAKILLDTAPKIKRLYCIDRSWAHTQTCASDPHLAHIIDSHGIDPDITFFDYAQNLLSEYSAARLLPKSSPYDVQWWTEPVDFIFEDSSHANPQLRDNLEFWVPLVRPGGIIAGHDYVRTWPDVIQEVDALAARSGAKLNLGGTVWWMIKP
jgi:predicted O-methyltransferase YrrM